MAENVSDQQNNDINSTPFISLCLDESIDITKSARLTVFSRYSVGNVILEELIAITSLLTTTKGTYVCTAVRNSFAEKEIDLKKIVSATTDGAPNMLQGSNKTVIVMTDLIRAFEAKLYVFRNDIITRNYKYFPNLKKNIKDLDAQEKRNEEKVIDDFISIIDSLIQEFSAKFSQSKELSETLKFIMYPDGISFDKLNLSQFD
ncbi:general transcription factor II-I repeat domain-containing protein 2A [Trichonephila clavipes]|nr:general transcription factor II-I repeat domain-containing protein 2A [Trichonephila clavipes]